MWFELLDELLKWRSLLVHDVVGDGALEAGQAKLAVSVRRVCHLEKEPDVTT